LEEIGKPVYAKKRSCMSRDGKPAERDIRPKWRVEKASKGRTRLPAERPICPEDEGGLKRATGLGKVLTESERQTLSNHHKREEDSGEEEKRREGVLLPSVLKERRGAEERLRAKAPHHQDAFLIQVRPSKALQASTLPSKRWDEKESDRMK